VRDNNNRDTPEPREIPRGENPPAGAVIDYLLPKDATGPVTITIQDAKGRVVQRLTSEPEPPISADLYFHASWLPKPAPLSTKAGAHRAVWNLRHTRPSAIRYEYSIAAAPDHGTIATPAGAYALPGQYSVTLEADGTKQRVPLTLLVDPRTRVSTKELTEILGLSQAVGSTLGRDYRLFAEISAIHKQAEALAKNATGDLATRLNELAEETRPSAKGQWAGLLTVNETLVGMASDLETGDYGPTAPQRQVHDEMKAVVAKSAVAWKKLGEEKIAMLNMELTKAGLSPLTIPKDGTPSEIEDEDGDNLP
jgi:hypothetical protein